MEHHYICKLTTFDKVGVLVHLVYHQHLSLECWNIVNRTLGKKPSMKS